MDQATENYLIGSISSLVGEKVEKYDLYTVTEIIRIYIEEEIKNQNAIICIIGVSLIILGIALGINQMRTQKQLRQLQKKLERENKP